MEIRIPGKEKNALLEDPLVRGLLDAVSDGAVVIDAEDRRILAMNPKARELLGYDEGEVLGCQCKDMMNSPACSLSCPLTAALEGRDDASELDLFYRGRDGEGLLHAHTRMVLVRGSGGKPIAGVELFADTRRVRSLERALGASRSMRGIVGRSAAIRSLLDRVEQIAPYDIPVVIEGESGVGKEIFASAIHHHSRRAERPYLRINCATLGTELAASELFGHRRGAFTGALSDRRGYFEEADSGTLLLDEVSELSLDVQAKLLRVLQEGEIQRLGEDRSRKVDVRVLAATNRPLDEAIAEGLFREDLYYRLMGVRLEIPPLRERREDIPLLVEHFLSRIERELGRGPLTMAPAALAALVERDWPGNARELGNVLRLAAIRAETGVVAVEHLDPQARVPRRRRRERLTLKELERRAIDEALAEANGNFGDAARRLGIDRTTLWRKMKRRGGASSPGSRRGSR